MSVSRIAAADAERLAAAGEAALLDLRAPAAFAAGHPRGSLSLPFSPRGLGDRARVVLAPERAVVLVAADEVTAGAAAAQLAAADVGVRGVVAGGFEAWRDADLPIGTIGEVTVEALPERTGNATVLDVREPLEHDSGHVPGALLVPLGTLRDALGSVPRTRPVVTICEAGVRSCVAASILATAGFTGVSHVPAGTSGYRRAGLPLAFPERDEAAR